MARYDDGGGVVLVLVLVLMLVLVLVIMMMNMQLLNLSICCVFHYLHLNQPDNGHQFMILLCRHPLQVKRHQQHNYYSVLLGVVVVVLTSM